MQQAQKSKREIVFSMDHSFSKTGILRGIGLKTHLKVDLESICHFLKDLLTSKFSALGT